VSVKYCILAFILCVTWMPGWAAVSGEASFEGDASADTVVFAIPDVWPWAYEDENGVPQGSLVELTRRMSDLAGVPVEARLRPLRRALIELEAGEVNFSLLFQSPALDARAVNVGQVTSINIILAAMADSDYPLTLDALAGKRIGFIRGTYLGEEFEHNREVEKVPVALIGQAIEMLPLGRLSAILASDHAILRSLETLELSLEDLRFSKHIDGQNGALYMSRKSPRSGAAEKFRDALEVMEKGNELEKIFFGEAGRPDGLNGGPPAAQ
jgi:ABC-type amino acid transport substrate-binding protein